MGKGVTISDILAECITPETTLSKEASVQKKASTEEIDQLVENLGFVDAETIKTASDEATKNGGTKMGLIEHYNAAFAEDASTTEAGTETAPAEGTTKVASEEGNEDPNDFGSLVAHYFNVGSEAFLEKMAMEGGGDHNPMSGLAGKSSLGATLGNVGDPHMGVNRETNNGQPLKAAVGNTSPYNMKDAIEAKTVLKQKVSSKPGDVGGYAQK